MVDARCDLDVGEAVREVGRDALPVGVRSPRLDGSIAAAREAVVPSRRYLDEGESGGAVALPGGVLSPGPDRPVAVSHDGVLHARCDLVVPGPCRGEHGNGALAVVV